MVKACCAGRRTAPRRMTDRLERRPQVPATPHKQRLGLGADASFIGRSVLRRRKRCQASRACGQACRAGCCEQGAAGALPAAAQHARRQPGNQQRQQRSGGGGQHAAGREVQGGRAPPPSAGASSGSGSTWEGLGLPKPRAWSSNSPFRQPPPPRAPCPRLLLPRWAGLTQGEGVLARSALAALPGDTLHTRGGRRRCPQPIHANPCTLPPPRPT